MTFERKTLRKPFGPVLAVNQWRIRMIVELKDYTGKSTLVSLLNPNAVDDWGIYSG
jgi:hypothetical protein